MDGQQIDTRPGQGQDGPNIVRTCSSLSDIAWLIGNSNYNLALVTGATCPHGTFIFQGEAELCIIGGPESLRFRSTSASIPISANSLLSAQHRVRRRSSQRQPST